MTTETHKIADFILQLALKENHELEGLTGKGLWQMPELAFAYYCGKEIFRNREQLLGSLDYKWKREETVPGGKGPSDLLFTPKDKKGPNYVIEFKMDDTYHAYAADIVKLSNITEAGWVKLFCSLKYVFVEGGKYQQDEEFIQDFKTGYSGAY